MVFDVTLTNMLGVTTVHRTTRPIMCGLPVRGMRISAYKRSKERWAGFHYHYHLEALRTLNPKERDAFCASQP